MGEIINTWDQLKAAAAAGYDKKRLIAISYHAPDRSNSRDVSTYKWSVWSPFLKTDVSAHWSDHGSKVFLLIGNGKHCERKKNALTAAMMWASDNYGPYNWVRNSQGCYVPKEINDNFPLRKKQR